MIDANHTKNILAAAQETGFMRGLMHAAKLARHKGDLELAVEINMQALHADTFILANTNSTEKVA